jgi:hypothetical protein
VISGRLAANKLRAAKDIEFVPPPKEKPCFPDGPDTLLQEMELSIYIMVI